MDICGPHGPFAVTGSSLECQAQPGMLTFLYMHQGPWVHQDLAYVIHLKLAFLLTCPLKNMVSHYYIKKSNTDLGAIVFSNSSTEFRYWTGTQHRNDYFRKYAIS